MNKDYYKILNLEKNASKDDIKKAFRKLAHEYHPDKGTGNEAKFKEVSEAYSVLSDDQKRAQYDTYGSNFASGGAGAGQAGGFGGGFDGFDFSQFTQGGNGQNFEFDLGDMFGDIFGGGGSRRGRAKRGRDISVDLDLTFVESIFGVEKTILLNKKSTCKTCGGTGAKANSEMIKCSTCAGKGRVYESRRSIFGNITTEATCPTCAGAGKVPKEKCSACAGEGIVKQQSELKIKIPVGIEDGEVVRLSDAGEAVTGGTTGDLYVKIHVAKHPIFHKEGNNLLMDLKIKLSEALLGTIKIINTLDGQIELKIPEGIAHGEVLRLKNKGVPTGRNNRGDILITIDIDLPRRLSKTAKKIIEELKNEGL